VFIAKPIKFLSGERMFGFENYYPLSDEEENKNLLEEKNLFEEENLKEKKKKEAKTKLKSEINLKKRKLSEINKLLDIENKLNLQKILKEEEEEEEDLSKKAPEIKKPKYNDLKEKPESILEIENLKEGSDFMNKLLDQINNKNEIFEDKNIEENEIKKGIVDILNNKTVLSDRDRDQEEEFEPEEELIEEIIEETNLEEEVSKSQNENKLENIKNIEDKKKFDIISLELQKEMNEKGSKIIEISGKYLIKFR
jgi:hypothetical protein